MSRPASGDAEVLQDAREAIACAKTVERLRQAQAVVFPLDYATSLADTAQAIGVSKRCACQLRTSGLPNTALALPFTHNYFHPEPSRPSTNPSHIICK